MQVKFAFVTTLLWAGLIALSVSSMVLAWTVGVGLAAWMARL